MMHISPEFNNLEIVAVQESVQILEWEIVGEKHNCLFSDLFNPKPIIMHWKMIYKHFNLPFSF